MAAEIHTFLIALLSVLSSLSFCYSIRNSIPKGFIRFLFILPISLLFLFLPLQFHTIHLQGISGFFIAWLGTFKLLLFAFGKGPLSSPSSSSSLARFLAAGSLPIQIQDEKTQNPQEKQHPWSFAGKILSLAVVVTAIFLKHHLPPNAALILYSLLIYLLLEVMTGAAAGAARAAFKVDLAPPFNQPYLATSLQDFWGKRWNLMVNRILRSAVFDPCRSFAAPMMGRKWGALAAVVATFVVSGVMHELIFFYMGREAPTWEVTGFFVVQGGLLTAEMAVKGAVGGRVRVPRVVSGGLTMLAVVVTSAWLFFPQFLRFKVDVRIFEEYKAVGAFLKNVTSKMITWSR